MSHHLLADGGLDRERDDNDGAPLAALLVRGESRVSA